MITYRATLDVPEQTVSRVSRWLAAHRKAHDRRPWQRAATPYVQAVLVLRWFKDATALPTLARDARVSIATAGVGIGPTSTTSMPTDVKPATIAFSSI